MDNNNWPGRPPKNGGLRLNDELRMESTGWYQIVVHGFLDTDWGDRLGGLNILTMETASGVVTTLTGEIADQTALFGILNALYDLHYPLLSVRRLDSGQR
jgi:hypothetical protein